MVSAWEFSAFLFETNLKGWEKAGMSFSPKPERSNDEVERPSTPDFGVA